MDAQALLDVWDDLHDRTRAEVAVGLLARDATRDDAEIADLPLGRRDAALLEMRRRWFGSRLRLRADCPGCGEALEVRIDVDELVRPALDADDEFLLSDGDDHVSVRAPTSRDVVQAMQAEGPLAQERALRQRCLRYQHSGRLLPLDTIPKSLAEYAERELARLDEQAVVRIPVDCGVCDHAWSAPVDIVTVLWREVDTLARRHMADVHELASKYGWREADILAISARRRKFYLEQV
jgi:hypothetical protein